MKKQIIFSIGSFIFILVVVFKAYSQDFKPLGQSTMTFLKIDPVARSVGMGEASTCMDKDVNALFHNPAGIASVSGGAISLNHTQYIADMKIYGLAAVYNHSLFGSFGASFLYMDNGEFTQTIPDGSEKGYHFGDSFTANQFAVGIGYGRQITDKFSIGGQVKYAYQDLGPANIIEQTVEAIDTLTNTESKEGVFALDFGTIYYTGFKDLRVAMSFRNFGPSVQYSYESFQIPLLLRIGIAMNVLSLFSDMEGQSLEMAVEASRPNDYSERINVGCEYGFQDLFYVRAGYRFNYDEGDLSIGFGFSPTVTNLNLRFDYAYTDYGDILGAVHRISFGFGL